MPARPNTLTNLVPLLYTLWIPVLTKCKMNFTPCLSIKESVDFGLDRHVLNLGSVLPG